MIEKKVYSNESSPEEIKALKKRVWIYKNKVIWVNETPILSPFSINTNFDQMDYHSAKMKKYALVIDLRNCARPDARTRREVNRRFMLIKDQLIHCAYISGRNALVNAAIKFVMYGMEHTSYSVSRTEAEALKKVDYHLKKSTYEFQL